MAEFKRREVAVEVSNTYHASALYNLMCTEREGNGVVLFCKVMVENFLFIENCFYFHKNLQKRLVLLGSNFKTNAINTFRFKYIILY